MVFKASLPGAKIDDKNDYSGYSPEKSVFTPYYFKTSLLAYGTEDEDMVIEFTATEHGGIKRVTFPHVKYSENENAFIQDRRISVTLNGNNDSSTISNTLMDDGTITISGFTHQNSGGVASNFAHYFVAALYNGKEGKDPIKVSMAQHADNNWAYVMLPAADPLNDVVTVRIATSFISIEQALVNLKAEVGTEHPFDAVMEDGKKIWNEILSRVTVNEVGLEHSESSKKDVLTTFYSCMYRAAIFPRQISEVDASGAVVHWSPYDGTVHAGPMSADSGFWDAYSTVYPLHTLLNRPQLSTMLTGWLNAYKEGGWLTKWSSPGYRTGMVGTMGDVTLADAIVKQVPDLDYELAYEAIRKDAYEVPPDGVGGIGRNCLSSYLQYGYIPLGAPMTTGGTCSEIVSRTLNYMQSDFAISKAAAVLGKVNDAAELALRASNYSAIFEQETGFFRSRSITDGKFTKPFDQFAWGGDYTEAGPWQYKFYVPWDPLGLSKVYSDSGRDICDDLQRAQTMKSVFHVGSYGNEIHGKAANTSLFT
jgi:predicted alpha-1,2-mannosidase